ncbi:MAG TPA: NAD(P)(+) transhydrogenase (Re/Si-specific) subunit beta [Deltaproteobacteria bacterium]|nr:NAD(P)(+) transhydrogenase (Re/Si-specific) subunit beta [Deltaproteobacteria bacterium]
MPEGLLTVSYIVAGVLFILSLRGLSNQETASRGNLCGVAGMIIAVLATILGGRVGSIGTLMVVMLVGGGIGLIVARRVAMTEMPELVAILHSFVGVAAVLVGIVSHMEPGSLSGTELLIHEIEIVLGVFIGAYTFTGSVIAFLKLRGSIGGKPLTLPLRHQLNLLLVLISVLFGAWFVNGSPEEQLMYLLIIIAIAGLLGIHMIMAIGGADMPVVVSMLNSYSGWAAASAGFMLSNDLLIITGALVGSSGAILSYIMCRGMNRSFISVIAGGFGVAEGTIAVVSKEDDGKEAQSTSAEETADLLRSSKQVIVVPGYGMAVAQAQHIVHEITKNLRSRNVSVKFAIHPVAGRLPGHMNVLLAEANLPYDIVFEMDEINSEFNATDVVLVIGANDIVNPGALDDESSPIFGMPVLEVWDAKTVIVLKRSMATGYSGVGNLLYFRDNTLMLFGDAKESLNKVAALLN